MIISSSQQLCKNPIFLTSFSSSSSSSFLQNVGIINPKTSFIFIGHRRNHHVNKYRMVCRGSLPFVDPWAPTIDSQSIAPQLFAFSLFPYIGFLYFITKSNSAPKLTLFGFYFLLAFVGATIPAGIYAKVHYGTSLSNVDWLHGGAESLLTLTNLFIVMGLREALRKLTKDVKDDTSSVISSVEKEENSSA